MRDPLIPPLFAVLSGAPCTGALAADPVDQATEHARGACGDRQVAASATVALQR